MGKYKDIISKRYGNKAASAALDAFEDEEKEREQRGIHLRSQNLTEQQNAYNAYQRAFDAVSSQPAVPQFQNTATAAGNAAAERANAARIALNAVNPAQSAGAKTAYDVLKKRYQGDVLSSHYTQKDAEAAQAQNLYRKYMVQAQTGKASSGVDQDAAIQLARKTGHAAAGAQTKNLERDLGSVNFGGNIAYRNMLRYYGPKNMTVDNWNNDARAKWTDEQKKAMKELDAAEKAAAAYDNPQYAQTQSTAGNRLFAQKHLEDTRKAAQKLGLTSNDLETYRNSSGGERNLQESLSYADDAVRKLGSGSQKDLLAIMDRRWNINSDPTSDQAGINREIGEFEERLRKENGWTDKQLRNYEQYASLLYENNKNDQNTYKTYVRQNDKKHDVADTIADNALSVAQNVFGAPSATIAHLGAVAGRSDRQQAASPYTQGAYVQNAAANTRSVTESGIKSNAGRFAYNVGMSAADSAAFALAAGGPALPAALSSAGFSTAAVRELTNAINLSSFSMSAGNQTYRQALEQGDDTRTALTKGVMDAAIEAATERIGGENMIKIATGKVKPGLAKAMLSQFGAEGIEETMGDIMNLVGQQALLGKKSDIEETIASYEKQGMSRAKARDKALKEWAVQLAEDTAAGGLSGLGMGAAASAASGAYGTAQTVRDLRNAGPEVYKNIGNSITSDSEAYHTEGAQRAAEKAKGIAENLAARTEDGGKAGILDRARLAGNIEMMNANESAYYEENPEQYEKDAEERQKHLQESVRVDFENRETPEQYRVKETDYSGSQGYQDMLKVSNSTGTMADKAASLGEIYNQMKNSKSPAARQYADAYYEMFSAKSGITGQAASLAKQTAQDAYLAGRSGEQFTAGTLKQKEAYNAGQIAYMKDISSRRAEDAEKVKNADVYAGSVKSRAKEFIEGRNGETMVRLENGSAVPFDAVDFGDDVNTYVWSHAARQGTVREKNAYIQNFKENVPLGVQDNAFRKYYTAGALDQSMERSENTSFDSLYEKDNSVYKALIDKDTLRNMYNAGAQETEAQYVKSMEESGNTVARRGTGRVYVYEKNGPVTDLTEEKTYTDRSGEEMYYLPLVKAFAKATNTDIVLSQNEGEKINGYYDRAMQRIVLNTNNREDLYHTLIHEGMGEVLEAFNTKGALKVRSALLKYTAEKYQGDELIRSVEKYQDAYTAVEKTKTVSAAMGEMMNDAMSGIFSSKEGIHDLSEWLDRKQGVKEQKSVLGTLADHFRGVETAMRNLLNRGALTSSGHHAAMIAEKNASKIRKMILDEMDVAIENAAKAQMVEGTIENKAYSIEVRPDGIKYVDIEVNQKELEGLSADEQLAKAEEIINKKFVGKIIGEKEGTPIVETRRGAHEYNWGSRRSYYTQDAKIAKAHASYELNNILDVSKFIDHVSPEQLKKEGKHPEAVNGIDHYKTLFRFGSTWYTGIINVLNQVKVRTLYDVTKIRSTEDSRIHAEFSTPTPSDAPTSSITLHHEDVYKTPVSSDGKRHSLNIPETRHFSLDVDKPVQQTKDRTQKMNAHENLRFSINVDNEGNQLNSDQQDYFKDSKVRDDAGNLLVMYHGTPQGGFTKFRNGLTYFTSNPEYAQEYEGKNPQRGQQSNPQLYKVYLNITHPFDTRNAADRKMFTNQYVKGGYALGIDPYSGETGLSENGLPDWNEADNIYDFLEENDLLDKYDGMVVDEAGSARGSDGFSYVTFNPNQEKNVDNVHPTSNDDIRYSLNDVDMPTDDQMLKPFDEMTDEEYRQAVNVISSVLGSRGQSVEGVHISKDATYRIAQDIIKQTGSSYGINALAENLGKIYSFVEASGKKINYNDLMRLVRQVAVPVIDHAELTEATESAKKIMASFRATPVRLTSKQLNEVKYIFGSLQAFKKAVPGIKISQNANVDLDQMWSSFVDESEGLLNLDTNEGDQPVALADMVASLQPRTVNAYEAYGYDKEEAANDVAMDIIRGYYQYASTKAAGRGAEEAARDIRGRVAEEQKKYRESVRDRYAKRYQDARTKAEEETDALRERMRDQYDSARENDRVEIANIKVKNNARWQKAAEQRRVEHERRMIDRHWGALFNMIDNPTDTRHVPKALQNVVLSLLDSMDMVNPHVHETENGKYRIRILDKIREDGTYEYVTKEFDSVSDAMEAYQEAAAKGNDTKTNRNWQEKMQKVATLYQEAKANTESSTGLDDFVANLDTDLSADLQKIVSDHGKVSVSQLDSYQLRILDRVMANVASSINKYNTFITDNKEQISGTAESIMSHASDVNGRKEHGKYVNAALDFVSLDNATPDTYFSGMGQGGQQVYKMLMNAMDTKTHDVRQAQEYMMGDGSRENGVYKQGALAGTSREEMEKWTGNNAEIMTFDADTGSRIEGREFGNGTITLTPAQLMSLYELTKRSQAMLHTKGGIKIDTITVKGIERTQKPQFLSIEALSNVVSNLTPQQKAVADAMQKFMGRQAATWGNAASNRMFGYDKFTEENYFPITVDKNTVATSNSDMSDRLINAIRNMGITKKTMPDAANPLVVKDIFDVFSGHINDMATYHAYAPAIQDLIRVYNYKTVGDVKGGFLDFKTVKDAIEALYGRGGNTYMKNLVGSLNQNERSNYTITRLGKLGSNYKAAAIGGNLRVVVQQPMAWFRAGMVIDYKYLMQGLAGNEMADTMRENTSDMCWAKSQGNVDGVITKGFKQQITGASTKRERMVNASMYLAGKADDITWSALYRAVYAEQEAEFQKAGKESQKGGSYTKEFADAVNSRFDDMVSRTQVIDSTLFRSNLMRSNDSKVQFFTSFMAEPTKTYNMFLREVIYAQQTKRNGRYTREAVRRIGKAAVVFTLTQLATAFAQSLADAFRRDDDDTKWIDAFLAAYRDNFIDDMNPFNLLPGVKDIWSMVDNARGIQSSGFYEQQALSNLIDTAAQDVKYMGQLRSGESTTKTAYGILMLNLRSIANFLAVPVYNVARTGAEIYNEMNDLWGGENLYKTNSDRQKHYRGAIMKAIESGDEEEVEKALDGYLKSGGKIGSTLKTEEKKELKEKYAEAYAEGNKSEMERIRRTTAPIFEESRKQKQQEAEESGEEVPEDFDPDEYYGKWLRESDQSRAAKESVFHAVDTGGDYKKSIEEAVKWGYSYKSISSALTRQYKQQYADALKKNRSEATVLKNRLAETYAYLSDRDGTYDGKSHKEKVEIYTKTIEKWGE